MHRFSSQRFSPGRAALALCSLLFAVPAATSGCAEEPPAEPPPPIAFERIEAALPTRTARWNRHAFDVLAADADLDGDTDLLFNWHHLEPLELLENRDGRFVRVEPARSGLHENRGVGDLYVRLADMEERLGDGGSPGLYVWHDLDRAGAWRFLWRGSAPLELEMTTSLRFTHHEGLDDDEVAAPGPRRLRVRLPAGAGPRAFSAKAQRVATQLRLSATAAGAAPALFVGAARTPVAGGTLEIWKPDPHGIAWLNVEGTPHPEVFVTRGGLGGLLAPPADPKEDRYYVHTGRKSPSYRRAPAGTTPRSYARGRRVEWVDLEGDGVAELSISNEDTKNALLVRDAATGSLRDRASAFGLDLEQGAALAWSDLDGDGLDDCFVLEGDRVDVLRNRGDSFERLPGDALGLVIAGPPAAPRFLDRTALRFADIDADGDLDLFVNSRASAGSNHLLRRDGDRFTDVTETYGLAGVVDTLTVVLLDADGDGFEDAASFGKEALLWHNQSGERFDVTPFDTALVPAPIRAAAAADTDGDGREDLVLLGRRPHLLHNITERAEVGVRVVLRGRGGEPLGALVTAAYPDGRLLARRYGSAHSSAFSQSLRPLSFGAVGGTAPDEIRVRWPGDPSVTRHPVRDSTQPIVVQR